MTTITLLHIFPSFGFGGQQARLAALTRALGAEFRHLVLSLDDNRQGRALFDENAPVEFNTYNMVKSAGFSVTNILTFRKLISSISPNLLCTYNWGSIEAVIANRLGPGAPHLHFEDGFGADEARGSNSRRDIARRHILKHSHLVVPSSALQKIAVRRWRLNPASVHFIENGVDVERLHNARPPLKSGLVIGSVGALRAEKNYARLVRAFQAADRNRAARLEIVGEGPERNALAAAAGGDARIALSGATPAPQEAYARFDVFALSSETEQAPLSMMEAMASGLPVVATDVGDIKAMVAEENRPFITAPGDDDAYAQALAQLMQNPSARAAIGSANRRKAREHFSIDRMAAAHRALYLSLARRDD